MLVLARKLDESLVIGDGIEIKIVSIQGSGDQATIRLGIEAPRNMRIWRKEVYDQVVAENKQAVTSGDELPIAMTATMKPPEDAKTAATGFGGLVLKPVESHDKS